MGGARGREPAAAFAAKDTALAHLAKVDVDVRTGTYVAWSGVSVAEYVETWLPRQLHQRPSSADAAGRHLRLHLVKALGSVALADVTRADVQSAMSGAALAPSSKRVLVASKATGAVMLSWVMSGASA